MADKLALITGSTSGIGYITALELAKRDVALVLHARDERKAKQTKDQLIKLTGNQRIDILLADFSSLEEVRSAANTFKNRYNKLDLLINNAGLILGKERQTSREGFERTIAINHLAPFLLTSLLFNALSKSTEARIINVASEAYRGAAPDFEDFNMEQSYSGWKAYCNSKLYNIMFTEELEKRIKTGTFGSNSMITTYSLHPGTVATNFSASAGGWVHKIFKLMRPFLTSPEQGASTSVYLSTETQIPAPGGTFFVNKKPVRVKHRFHNPENNRKLWDLSEKLTGATFPLQNA